MTGSAPPSIPADAGAVRRNFGWLAADRAYRLAIGLAVNVWMVRALGAAKIGLLGFTQSLTGLLAILGQLGLEAVLVRELVRRPDEAGPLLGTSTALRAAGAVAATALAVAAMPWLRPGDTTALALAAVFSTVTLFQALDGLEHWFRSRSEFGPFVVARAVAFTLSATAKAACLLLGLPLVWLAGAIALEFAIGAVLLAVVYARFGGRFGAWRFDTARARTLFASSWPLMLSSVAIVIYARTDQVMITLMRGDQENGIYAAAQRLSEILYFVPVALSAAAAPALHVAFGEGSGAYTRRLQRLFDVLGRGALAAAIAVSLLAGWGVVLLFGPAFAASGPVLALHVWAAPAVFLGVAQSHWFVAHGREGGLLVRSVVGAVTNVLLNLWLIPRHGAVGAAAATLVSQVVAMWLFNLFPRDTRALFRMQCRALLLPVR